MNGVNATTEGSAMQIEPQRQDVPAKPQDAGAQRPKAPYAPPSLTRYGTVRELTKGGKGSKIDGANTSKK